MGKLKSGIRIGIYKTPKNSGDGLSHCARVITQGTKRSDQICKFISDASSLNSSDIKGVLEALTTYIGRELSYGYSVELEGLGHFSPSVKSRQIVNEKGKTKSRACVDGVNFRCSPRLKGLVKEGSLVKIKRENLPENDLEGRKKRMLAYLEKHAYINVSVYASLNSCSRYQAGKDIKTFEQAGIIVRMGYRTHRIYVLPMEEGEE